MGCIIGRDVVNVLLVLWVIDSVISVLFWFDGGKLVLLFGRFDSRLLVL